MRVMGITGTIGAGKSTVARWLAELGVRAIDADVLVHRLYASDRALQSQLRTRFGAEVIVDGAVYRPGLAKAVLGQPQALADLEALVHPLVHRLEEAELSAAEAIGISACAIEAIRLVESGASARCDELWIVVAAERVQLARLAARGVPEADARRWMASQGSVPSWTAGFLAESDRLGHPRPVLIVDNSGSTEEGRAQVRRLWHRADG